MSIYGFDGSNKQRVQVPTYTEFKASEITASDSAIALGNYAKLWCMHVNFTVESWLAEQITDVNLSMPQSYQDEWSASDNPGNKFKVFATWRSNSAAVVVRANPGATQIVVSFKNLNNETLTGGDFDILVVEV